MVPPETELRAVALRLAEIPKVAVMVLTRAIKCEWGKGEVSLEKGLPLFLLSAH